MLTIDSTSGKEFRILENVDKFEQLVDVIPLGAVD